ncbi:MAG: LysE family transporter [Phreatobacter sp.]|uniref:LysE family translocator n=1 Tax=Phreatobacter sp. TaxID=1966341 RepID=UPI001A41E56E|nr:LysE family transporter [Phreatobacter sp.]MBL8567478.1 LysE family transporter [Phreatobacter sp.]
MDARTKPGHDGERCFTTKPIPMLDTSVLLTLTLMWLVIVPTPGANSLLITHLAVTRPAEDVAFALAGNLAGVAMLALLALFGWAALLQLFPWLRLAVTIFGALYLVWFGARLVRRSLTPAATAAAEADGAGEGGARRMVLLGLVTALSNAQAIIFITSIFAVSGVLNAGVATGLAAILVMITCNGLYLSTLAWLFQRQAVRRFYQRFRRALEGTVGALFVVFGGRLLLRELMR